MQLTQAAREAVRVVALGGNLSDAIVLADAASRTNAAVGSGLLPAPTTTVVQRCPAGDSTTNAKATVSYSYRYITPLGPIARLFGASTLPNVGTVQILTANGVMRCSG